MPVGSPTALAGAASGTNGTAYSSASITPTANRLVLAAVASSGGSGATANPPTVVGNSLTWELVATVASGAGEAATTRVSVFRAMGASPTAGAVAFTFGVSQDRAAWSIVEYPDIDTSGTNGSGAVIQSKTAAATSGTAGTADFDAAFGDATNNATYSAIGVRIVAEAITHEAGFTELHDVVAESQALETMWRLGEDQNPAPTWTTSGQWAQVIVEIKSVAGGGTPHTATQTDPEGLTDSATFVAGYERPLTDPVGLLDSISVETSGADEVTKTDPLGLTDLVVNVTDSIRTADEDLGLTDSVTAFLGQEVTITDNLGLTDAGEWFEVAPDPLGLTDSVSYQLQSPGNATVTDTLGLVDAISTVAAYNVTITDELGLTDTATPAGGLPKPIPFTVSITDQTPGVTIVNPHPGGHMTVGETFVPQATFRDADEALYDPTSVTAETRSPSGAVNAVTVDFISLGIYQVTLPLDEAGVWRVQFTGTGPDGQIVIGHITVCAVASVMGVLVS